MAQSGQSHPALSNADGHCFSCGRGPSTSSFAPMPTRSPKNTSGGGFRANSPTKKATSMKNLRKMMDSRDARSANAPNKMERASSLPDLPAPQKQAPLPKTERAPENVKLPGLHQDSERPANANVEA